MKKAGTKKQGNPSFVTRITLRNGRVIYAKDYGFNAFPLRRRK